MIISPFINPGDRIRIVSPAGKITQEKAMPGIELLRKQGFEVLIGKNVFGQHFQYSGTDEQRAADLQEAIDDPQTKAIICSRGGYGAVRLIEHLDLSALKSHPKWLVGFSDITILHSVFNQLELASIHGAMTGSYMQEGQITNSFNQLTKLLSGDYPQYTFEATKMNRKGSASGVLTGGNLSLLYSLNSTKYELQTKGKILFIEDISEYLYHIDRMMINLRLSGKLKDLSGLIVGGFTDVKDNESPFGMSVEEIIMDAVRGYNFPVCFNFPAGHIDENMPLILGAKYQLSVDKSCTLQIKTNG